MADLRVSELPPLAGTDLAATDLLPVADLSASETRRLTAKELVQNGVALIDDGSLPGAKLAVDSVTAAQIAPDAITASELANSSVDTAALMDLAVTNSKIAAGVDGAKLIDDTVTAAKIPAGSLDRGLDKTSGKLGHTNAIAASVRSGISYDAQGHITAAVALVPSDLPIATDTTIGGASVPAGSGLTVSGLGALGHANAVTPATHSGVSYDDHGHITGIVPLVPGDLPIATNTAVGAVSVPGPALSVDTTGGLTHDSSGVAAGTYPKVTVDVRGHVTAGVLLGVNDIPNLPAEKLNTGTLDPARIGNGSIKKEKFDDYATTVIQEADPGVGDYVGQFWYKESDAQLRVWSGNSWIPVGFGRLSQENLRFCGTWFADTSTIDVVTAMGTQSHMVTGAALPTATDALAGAYLVTRRPGTHDTVVYDNGDWVLCMGASLGWVRVDTLNGAAGGGAAHLGDLTDVTLVAPATGDTLIFDANTNRWVNRPTAARKAGFVESVDGARSSFTLTLNADGANNLLVSLGGIIQEPGVDFSFVAPRTINFAAPPPAGIEHWVLIEGVPSSGATGGGGGGTGGGGTTLPNGTAANEFLRWDNALALWGIHQLAIADMADFVLTTPTDGDMLQMTAGKWVNTSTIDEGVWT